MNEIQIVFGTKEKLQEAVTLCIDNLGQAWFTMQPKSIQTSILLCIGKYYNEQKLKLNEK